MTTEIKDHVERPSEGMCTEENRDRMDIVLRGVIMGRY
jgi:hypothetical protein